MFEPAAAVTDWLLAALSVGLGGWCAWRKRWPWTAAFAVLAAAAAAGALYHAELKPTEHGPAAWRAVSLLVATALLALYLASAAELALLRTPTWGAIGALSIASLAAGVAVRFDDLPEFLATQGLAMAGLLFLWLRAWRNAVPGAHWFVAAIAASAAAAGVRALPLQFELYWVWNHDGLYHLAQIPGLLLLARGAVSLPRSPVATRQDAVA